MNCKACNNGRMEPGGAACRVCCPHMRLDLIPYCVDCGSQERAVFWGGGPRCQACSDKFGAQIQDERRKKFQRERDAYNSHVARGKQDGECPDDGVVCSTCCEHEEHDHGVCNDCGEDISDELTCQAEMAHERFLERYYG